MASGARPNVAPHPIFDAIASGDIGEVTAILDGDPAAAHAKRVTYKKDGTVEQGSGWPSALQIAAEEGHLGLVKLLIARGAEPYEPSSWGYPAVFHAHYAEQKPIVAWFLGEGAQEERMRGAPTYGFGIDINLAARLGWVEIVKKHIAFDPLAIHRRGVIGETPLHWSSHNGHLEIVKALLDAGADIEADEIGAYGGKPLHWAAEHAPEVVRFLLSRGAKVDSRNMLKGPMRKFTPLLMCAKQKNDSAECAELLLAAGADVNAQADAGGTALDLAVAGGHKAVELVVRKYIALGKK